MQSIAEDKSIKYSISADHSSQQSQWFKSIFNLLSGHLGIDFAESLPGEEPELSFEVQNISRNEWISGSATDLTVSLSPSRFIWKSGKDTRQYGGVQDQLQVSRLILKSIGLSYPNGDPWDNSFNQDKSILSYNEGDHSTYGHSFLPTELDLQAAANALKVNFVESPGAKHSGPVIHVQSSDEQLMIGSTGVADHFFVSIIGVDDSDPSTITFDEQGWTWYNKYKNPSIGNFNSQEGDKIFINKALFYPYTNLNGLSDWLQGEGKHLEISFRQFGNEVIDELALIYGNREFGNQEIDEFIRTSSSNVFYNNAGKLMLNINGIEPNLGYSSKGDNDYLVAFVDTAFSPLNTILPNSITTYDSNESSSATSNIDSLTGLSVRRLRNSGSSKFLFSSNEYEINLLTDSGWFDEGISYNEPIKGNASVYRFNITTEGRHFYTANEYERDLLRDQMSGQGWIYEGAAFKVYGNEEAPDDAVPIVRYFNNTQGHLYSSSSIEQNILNSDPAWINEGIAWYGEAAI